MDGFLCQSGAFKITFPVGAGICVLGFRTIEGTTIAGWGHDFLCGKKDGLKVSMKGVTMAQTHRTHGVPVVCTIWRYKLGALTLPVLGERLENDFETCFHRCGTVIRKKNTL
jgi:hypothetical protein